MFIKSLYRHFIKNYRAPYAPALSIRFFFRPGSAGKLKEALMSSQVIESLENFNLEGKVLDTTANYRCIIEDKEDCS